MGPPLSSGELAPRGAGILSAGVLLWTFVMTAELLAHGRQQLVGVTGVAARLEAAEQRGADHGRGDAFVDGRSQRPAPFARIGHAALECVELRVVLERTRGQVEQPR